MKFELITLFPEYFEAPLRLSMLGRGRDKELFDIGITNLRDYAEDRHGTVDDRPFGGTAGMVLKVDVLDRCLQALGHRRRDHDPPGDETLVLTSAAGRPLDQTMAKRWSMQRRITIICGHYLGVDERLLSLYEIEEVSIGDYTLTGGEPAALVMVDAAARLIPGVLGNFSSAVADSHMDGALGTPHYTRPADYRGLKVPASLMSGDHARIERFRQALALQKGLRNRPDLVDSDRLSPDERELLNEFEDELKETID